MAALGLQEVVTTSLIGEHLLEKTGFEISREQLVTVCNSHSSEHTHMRQSLLPNLLEIAKYNQAQGVEDVWVYELGRTYFKLGKANLKNSGVSEKLSLSVLITGSIFPAILWHALHNAISVVPAYHGWLEEWSPPGWSYPIAAAVLMGVFGVLWSTRRPARTRPDRRVSPMTPAPRMAVWGTTGSLALGDQRLHEE